MDNSIKQIKLLDCTLRDGSYANNFTFTKEDTSKIVGRLDELGFDYIEVGHGIGLGASVSTEFKAVATDVEYMQAAARSIDKSKWGMFCIPGVATLDDVRSAADNGMDFIRIGSDLNNVSKAIEFIDLSQRLGLEVLVNFMKSYVVTPEVFSETSAKVIDHGVELIYLVDSSGSMLPDEIQKYIQVFYEKHPETKLGFHGHNNLGLSVYNSLLCVQEGVNLIDTTIQGFGRGAGNTPVEEFIGVLSRYGIDTKINYIDLLNFSEEISSFVIRDVACSSIDVVSGFAGFHSSYTPRIFAIAEEYSLDPKEIIIELCKLDKSEAPPLLLQQIAKNLINSDHFLKNKSSYNQYYGQEQD